ncbi:MAG: TolC family protein [Myxococcota bacterium]
MRARLLTLLPWLCLAGLAACKNMPEWHPENFAAPAPSAPWIPQPKNDEAWFAPPPATPDDVDRESAFLDLVELLDIGLRNSPDTKIAWEGARAAAAAYGSARGELYPTIVIGGDGQVANTDNPYDYVNANNDAATWLVQGKATLNYLLTDFGGRRARITAARQALYVSNWLQNQTLQNVIQTVATAYYQEQGSAAEVTAYEVSVETAATTTAAAQARLDVGVGTISDVLQAKANEAQILVDLAGARGDTQVAHGELAVAVGWPANTRFDIEPAAETLPFDSLLQDADQLIDLSYESRPILAAALSLVREREAQLTQAKAQRRPTLSSSGLVGEQLLRGETDDDGFVYEATLNLSVPIFTGGTLASNVREANARLAQAREALALAEQEVSSAVWSAYYDLRTAIDQVKANEVLLESSAEAYDVALKRFQNGIGDIVELLNAQALLADARAAIVRSRTNTLTSYADLVHAVGTEVPTGAQ